MNLLKNKPRLLLRSIFAGVLLYLLYLGIVPSGKIVYSYDFDKSSDFISKLTPIERVEPSQNGKQRIINDPVYFSLRTSRSFSKAIVDFKYQNLDSEKQPIIEAGILVDNTIWRYELKPIENYIIDKLSANWNVIQADDIIFLQKNKKYQSIQEFKEGHVSMDKIATYNYDLNFDYVIDNYVKSDSVYEFNHGLRGSYQFLTYVKNEELSFEFLFKDINKNSDPDPIDVHFYFADKLIDVRHLDDDGVKIDSGDILEARSLNLSLSDLPEGVYKIEVRCNDDILTDAIKTKQSKISFVNKIWLHNNGLRDIDIYTDSSNLRLQTIYPDSLQIVAVEENNFNISETYKQFMGDITYSSSTQVKLEKDGIVLAGDGYFSFEKSQLFNPNSRKININTDIEALGIEYVVAKYTPAQKNGDWKQAEIEFDLSQAYRENNKYSFLISIPGIDPSQGIEIDEIRVRLEGTSLWEKARGMLK